MPIILFDIVQKEKTSVKHRMHAELFQNGRPFLVGWCSREKAILSSSEY